ncbi:sugar 3,4-ketoisomerase [Shewanella algae]|uniref:sugar 3,4-ketoisomerase n=1 Tax=Shewanella algae TaxID=38313 RepID=UPI003AAF88EB
MGLVNYIYFNELGDERGQLISLEGTRNIPFEIKRIYYIFDTKNVPRGFHAHKELRQVVVCLKGQCRIFMDDGTNKENVILNSPSKGLIIEPMQWHEMHNFSEDCILMVLADNYYIEKDYIRTYEDFICLTQN